MLPEAGAGPVASCTEINTRSFPAGGTSALVRTPGAGWGLSKQRLSQQALKEGMKGRSGGKEVNPAICQEGREAGGPVKA